MIIDTHTHIYSEKTHREYFSKAKKVAKALTLFYPLEKYRLEEILAFVETKKDLFLVGSIDMDGNVQQQIKTHEELFQNKKIYGIKLYPGYQLFFPSDKKVHPIAQLCQKYQRPLIFHSGDVYSPDNQALLKYSQSIHIDELAVKFPKCKIIISHFGFPAFLQTANIVSKNKNVYTDISGTLDQGDTKKEEKKMFKQYIKDLNRVFNYFPDIKEKIMFATDFGGEETPLSLINPYVNLVNKLFSGSQKHQVFSGLAENIFFS